MDLQFVEKQINKQNKLIKLLLIFIALIFLAGCASEKIEYVGRKDRTELMSQSIISGNELSYKTKQYMAINDLSNEYEKKPEAVIKKLVYNINNPDNDAVLNSQGVRFTLFVLMELCVNQARNTHGKEALKYWMSACYYSYRYIFDQTITPPLNKYYAKLGLFSALHFYDISLSEISDYLIHKKNLWESQPEFDTVEGKIKFDKLKSDLLWSPRVFKKMVNVLDFLPKNFLAHSFDSGIGVPMIGIRNEDSNFEADKEMTMLNKSYPFIFVLKFNDMKFKDGVVKAQPVALGAYKNEYITINDFRVPLYKDYSILIGKALESKKYINGIKYMFDPGKMGELQELYLLSPFDPDKIPVFLVHGLMSEPRTWAQALNLLMSNRQIRENYQFIFYSYPTGQPSIISAAQFRDDMKEFEKKYNPDNNNSKFDYTVLIGHSMGGLLSSLVCKSSKGDYLLDLYLGNNIDLSKLNKQQIDFLRNIFVFEPLPFIKKLILIGTPHRGAEMATYIYSRIGSWITSIPASLSYEAIEIMKGMKKSQKNKDIKALKIPTGIEDLAPGGNKENIVNLPYGENIKIYSIIGDKDEAGKVGGTDGVVAYESAHINNVEREVIIKSGHDEIKKAACIKEIMKILLENLEDYNKNSKETEICSGKSINENKF